jgi:predicted ATP-binding protein involved in virulence
MMENSKFKYFTRLELENIRCFGTKQTLDLSDGNGNPTRWNLILGDNGVGKTTLLEFLAWMRPEPANGDDQPEPINGEDEDKNDKNKPNLVTLVPSLQNEENRIIKKLPKSILKPLSLRAEVSQDSKLVNTQPRNESSWQSKNKKSVEVKTIVTTVDATFKKNGDLDDYISDGNIEIENVGDIVENYKFPFIVVYGANRFIGKENKDEARLKNPIDDRLTKNIELYDAEEILQDLDYAVLKFPEDERNKNYFKAVKTMIVRVLHLDSSEDILINPTKRIKDSPNPDGVSFKTFSGEVGISALSLGYQTTLAWTLDLAWRLYENYPESDEPLKNPAIVLIDELDLHLHPSWQLRIMDDLTETFPNIQFIATSHSPLLVQSSSATNFAVIQKHDDEVVIINDPVVVKSWRIDQILNSELFGIKTSRDKKTETLITEKYKLLDKRKRTPEDEEKLSKINEEILKLPTIAKAEGEQKAIDFLTRAAHILKEHGVVLDD